MSRGLLRLSEAGRCRRAEAWGGDNVELIDTARLYLVWEGKEEVAYVCMANAYEGCFQGQAR